MSAQDNARTGVDEGAGPGIVVAIDGPSGSGKSSTSKGVAAARGFAYLDTGAMYRAVTWWMMEHRIDVEDAAAVASAAPRPQIAMGTDPSAPTVQVDGVDVAAAIRSPEVTAAVSAVSAVPAVRERLVALQREAIAQGRRERGGIVAEGRDITTVVAPDAAVKLFLTASADARAQRRSREVRTADVDGTREALDRRDQLDSSRAVAPLRRTADAVELETTGLTLDEVVDLVAGLVDEAAAASPAAT
ncbi:(d)CMP kinase [Nocardiopsis coralliicola]